LFHLFFVSVFIATYLDLVPVVCIFSF